MVVEGWSWAGLAPTLLSTPALSHHVYGATAIKHVPDHEHSWQDLVQRPDHRQVCSQKPHTTVYLELPSAKTLGPCRFVTPGKIWREIISVLWVETTRETLRLKTTNKKPSPTCSLWENPTADSEQTIRKTRKLQVHLERKITFIKNRGQPTLSPTTPPILLKQGRDTAASRTKS